jgi:heat shock protein HslJ
MRATLFALSVALMLPLGACEGTASDNGQSFAEAVEGRSWAAKAIGGKDVIEGTKVTLKIEGGRVGGKAGCNVYGGSAEIHGDQVKFGAIFSTKMACMAGGVMEQEQRYLNLLQSATHGEIRNDGALTLTGSAGAITFRRE